MEQDFSPLAEFIVAEGLDPEQISSMVDRSLLMAWNITKPLFPIILLELALIWLPRRQ